MCARQFPTGWVGSWEGRWRAEVQGCGGLVAAVRGAEVLDDNGPLNGVE